MRRVYSFCLTGYYTQLRSVNAHALGRLRWRRCREVNRRAGRYDAADILEYSFHRKRRRARGRQRAYCAYWSAAPRGCAISSQRKVRETPARGARQSVFYQKHRRQFGRSTNSRPSVLAYGRFPSFLRNTGESEVSHETDSHEMRDGDAMLSPGGGWAGNPLRTLHR
jgi:hypothetical protein